MNTRNCSIIALTLFVMALFVPPAQAAVDEDRIARLEAQLAAMQAELAALKSQQVQQPPAPATQAQIDAAVTRAMQAHPMEIPAIPDWIQNIKIKGDFRYRYEWSDNETKTADRNRNRIQARVGIYGKVNPEVDFGFRIASGNNAAPDTISEGSPTSNNQDLTNAFSSKNIWMDLAYFDYHPASVSGLNILGGKILNPFYRVGNSDLMFDSDVTPEGVAAVYTTQTPSGIELFGAAGGFYLKERSTEADTSLWGVQGAATFRYGQDNKSYLTAGAGRYCYGNIKGETGLGLHPTEFYGNTNTNGVYNSDFDIVQAFGQIGVPVGGMPVKFFGDYMKNTSAETSEDTAFLVGAGIGKCTEPGTWAFTYNYRDVEADAIVGVLAEATFAGGGTNVKGHKFSYAYQLAKNWQMALNYMAGERTRTDTTDYDIFQVDLKFKF